MPRRRRGQEFKRALRRAVKQAEAEVRAEDALASAFADPLSDAFWNRREGKEYECCSDCDGPNHPLNLLADAQKEIDEHLKGVT